MTELLFEVPPSFWNDHTPAAVHLRRVTPGHLEVVSTELAEAFFSGSGPLALPSGWHELVEIQLAIKTVDGEFGIKPRLHLRRIPIDSAGWPDRGVWDADRALPEDERRTKHGWWPNEEERTAIEAAIALLADEHGAAEPWLPLDFLMPMFRRMSSDRNEDPE